MVRVKEEHQYGKYLLLYAILESFYIQLLLGGTLLVQYQQKIWRIEFYALVIIGLQLLSSKLGMELWARHEAMGMRIDRGPVLTP